MSDIIVPYSKICIVALIFQYDIQIGCNAGEEIKQCNSVTYVDKKNAPLMCGFSQESARKISCYTIFAYLMGVPAYIFFGHKRPLTLTIIFNQGHNISILHSLYRMIYI